MQPGVAQLAGLLLTRDAWGGGLLGSGVGAFPGISFLGTKGSSHNAVGVIPDRGNGCIQAASHLR